MLKWFIPDVDFLHFHYFLTKVNKCYFTDEGTKAQIGSVCSICISSFGVLACEHPQFLIFFSFNDF